MRHIIAIEKADTIFQYKRKTQYWNIKGRHHIAIEKADTILQYKGSYNIAIENGDTRSTVMALLRPYIFSCTAGAVWKMKASGKWAKNIIKSSEVDIR